MFESNFPVDKGEYSYQRVQTAGDRHRVAVLPAGE